jgi:hypothetical protein
MALVWAAAISVFAMVVAVVAERLGLIAATLADRQNCIAILSWSLS